jgi:molybdopterin molybdotransferase
MMAPDLAFELLTEKIRAWTPRTETLPLEQAAGRIAAKDVVSGEYVPRFDRSAMDGYAVIAADTAGASASEPVLLRVIGQIEMGKETNLTLAHGQCASIPTGGMLPAHADGIVIVEDTERGSDQEVTVYAPAAPGRHIAHRGEDMSLGDTAVPGGSVLTPGKLGALAALGITEVPVYQPLNLFLISTGDELVPPGREIAPGEVRDINSYSVSAQAAAHGFRITGTALLKDDADLLRRTVAERLPENDVICVSGGSSVGEKDVTYDIINEVTDGGVFTHGIRIKPGKPTILGWHEETKTIVAGLPGHPASAAIVFNLLFCRMSRVYTGTANPIPIPAALGADARGDAERDRCQTVALSAGDGGILLAEPIPGASGMITTLSGADGYFVIPREAGTITKGTTVMVHPLY